MSLDRLLQQAEDLLVTEIPRAVRAARVREVVYGLLVQFTGVDSDLGGFPPPLFLPTEALRRRLLAEHPKDSAWYPWAVPEWEDDPGAVRVACHNPTLDEKLHLIFQLTVPSFGRVGTAPSARCFSASAPGLTTAGRES